MTYNPRILFVIESINLITRSQLFIPHRRACSFCQLERRRDRGTGSQLSSVRFCGVPISSRLRLHVFREDQASAASQWQPPSRPHPGLQVATPTPPSLPVTTPFRTLATLWTQYEPQLVALLWLLLKTLKSLLVPSWWHWQLAPLGSTEGALLRPLELLEDGFYFADSSLQGGGYEWLSHLVWGKA